MVRKGQGILYKFEDGGVYNGRACITGVTSTLTGRPLTQDFA